jgi:hypothetical protein
MIYTLQNRAQVIIIFSRQIDISVGDRWKTFGIGLPFFKLPRKR